MKDIDKEYKTNIGSFIFFVIVIMIHILFVMRVQTNAGISCDEIFTYTLANNPYSFEFIDPAWKHLPQNNGWIDAGILKESYVVENYDRFNYFSVYFHQRIDVHPLLYYSCVHTICSCFPGQYSKYFTLVINLIFVIGIDFIFLSFFKNKYGKALYALVPISFFFVMPVMLELINLSRMYTVLAFFCLWYSYLHWKLIEYKIWKKNQLVQFIICIFLGTQTHYYFYVYAALLSTLCIVLLIIKKERYKLINYLYSGMIGISASWILFPWIIWHIFFNQLQKHTEIEPWSVEKLHEFFSYLNIQLFNSRIWIAAVIGIILIGILLITKKKICLIHHSIFEKIIVIIGVIYSIIIYSLDGSVWYYLTPFYIAYVLWLSMALINSLEMVITCKKSEWIITGIGVFCIMSLFSISTISNIGLDSSNPYVWDNNFQINFSEVPQKYIGYDCIFVEERRDNLLQNYYFEFGDYDEFKRLSVDKLNSNGINKVDLSGRVSDNDIIVYIPKYCIIDKQEYNLLASDGNYNIYLLGRKEREL